MNQQNLFLVMNDDIIIPQDGRKRPRPRQVVGPSYENSPWERMLREEAADLQIPTSTAALLFRRRFRSPFSWFEMLMIDTRKWQCNASTHDVAGR